MNFKKNGGGVEGGAEERLGGGTRKRGGKLLSECKIFQHELYKYNNNKILFSCV